jgi:hypothetical protein
MSVAIPQSVRIVLNTYIALVNQALPGLLEGVYLHGSIALGAFNSRLSDVDVIVVISRRCTPSDIATLHAVHSVLSQRYPHPQFEGSYLRWQDLGQFEDTIPPHPYIHDHIFHPNGYHDVNAVTWWILKHRGIAVVGPPRDQLDIHVDWDSLIAKMHHNLNTYWARFTTQPRRISWLLTDYGIQWTVLGVLRQFYTFREHAITSKEGAGFYGLAHTPTQWHPLIREAIAIRAEAHPSRKRFRIRRAIMARAFLQLIITACNNRTA